MISCHKLIRETICVRMKHMLIVLTIGYKVTSVIGVFTCIDLAI